MINTQGYAKGYINADIRKSNADKRRFMTGNICDHLRYIRENLRSKTGFQETRTKGFTLIELMLVVIIIGALVAMVMPRLTGRGEQARVATATADIQANIATGLKLYELDNGAFPSTEEGLNALLNKPSSAQNWNGPYLEKKPIDPWNREYKYKSPGEHRADYDLYSLGKDGVEGADDVKNWE